MKSFRNACSDNFWRRPSRMALPAIAVAALAAAAACNVHVDPIEVKPVTVNMNVNIIDEKLDRFFAFQERYEQSPATRSATHVSTDLPVNAENVQ